LIKRLKVLIAVSFVAFASLFFLMLVVNRIAWLKLQVEIGRRAHMTIGSALDSGKAKYNIILTSVQIGMIRTSVHFALCHMLDQLRFVVLQSTAADRGHKRSDGKRGWFPYGSTL
jgi:hypothetical protein